MLSNVRGCIMADHDNSEALASAHVLARCLAPTMMDRGMPILVLGPDAPEIQLQDIQPTTLILMCSKNCFASSYVVQCLLKARFLNSCSVLPVISDEEFIVPDKAGWGWLGKGKSLPPIYMNDESVQVVVLRCLVYALCMCIRLATDS